jgi:hypothetical protein
VGVVMAHLGQKTAGVVGGVILRGWWDGEKSEYRWIIQRVMFAARETIGSGNRESSWLSTIA